jgi:hypothetical protein
MKPQIPLFRFTLGAGQSIGPASLRSLWILACKSVDVSVGRDGAKGPGKPIYSLYASSRMHDLPDVERRLRRLLEEAKLTASVVPLHLS